jgi:hypothetical protein
MLVGQSVRRKNRGAGKLGRMRLSPVRHNGLVHACLSGVRFGCRVRGPSLLGCIPHRFNL